MNCSDARERMSWYLDGEAPELEPHVAECAECRAYLEQLRRVDALLFEAAPYLVSRAPQRRVIPWRGVAKVAAAGMVGVLGWWLWVNLDEPDAQELFVYGGDSAAAGSEALLRVMVREGGAPVSGATVVLTAAGRREKRTTDAAGMVVMPVAVPDTDALEVTISCGADTISHRLTVTRPTRVLLSTSKPLYQPMQSVEMRALAINAVDMKPIGGAEAVFEVEDPNGNTVFRRRERTSAYGIADATFTLADEIAFGRYRVRATVRNVTSERTVDVKKYVLPKFRVNVTLDRDIFAPGEPITGAVSANYFFGKPVEGETRITLLSNGAEVASVKGLKANDRFEIAGAAGDVRLVAEVIDTADHRERGYADIVVTHEPLEIHVIPESGEIVTGIDNTVYIVTSYADGRAAPCSLTVNGSPVMTDATGIGVVDGIEGGSILEIRADDGRGRTKQQAVHLGQFVNAQQDFVLRTDRASYRAGETMTASILARGPPGWWYLDLVRERQTVATYAVEVKEGRGELAIDLSPELIGTLRVAAYHISATGEIVRDVRSVVVGLPAGLTIRPRPLRDEYRPGEPIEVEFEVLGSDGAPVQAALGVSMVDEALFALVEEAPGFEREALAVNEDLLKPRWQLKSLAAASWLDAPAAKGANVETRDYVDTVASVTAEAKRWEHGRWVSDINGTMGGIASGILGTLAFLWFMSWTQKHRPGCLVEMCIGATVLGILMALLLPATQSATKEIVAQNEARNTVASDGASPPAPITVPKDSPPEPEKVGATPPRLRQYFPELLYWNPQLITDATGRARVTMPPADSITEWRLAASGISLDGRFGAAQTGIRVFQDFFVDIDMPVAITQLDEISLPVAVYNYLDAPQTVELNADGFEILDGATRRVELAAGEVSVAYFRIRAGAVGRQEFTVDARGTRLSDAIRREVDVLPDGKPIPFGVSDRLVAPCRHTFTIPAGAIDGASGAWLRLFPSPVAETVTGLEGLVQLPYG